MIVSINIMFRLYLKFILFATFTIILFIDPISPGDSYEYYPSKCIYLNENSFICETYDEDKEHVYDYFIYSLKTQKKHFIFKDSNRKRNLIDFYFEKQYDAALMKILLNEDSQQGSVSRNNFEIKKRTLSNNILLVEHISDHVEDLWLYNSTIDTKPRKLTRLEKFDKFHIDIRNRKIFIIFYNGGNYRIEKFRW